MKKERFDDEYQFDLLQSLFESKQQKDILAMLDANAFNEDLIPVVQELKDLIGQYGKLPARSQIRQVLKRGNLPCDWLDRDVDPNWERGIDIEQIKRFVQHQALRKSLMTGLELLETGRYDEIVAEVLKTQEISGGEHIRKIDLFQKRRKIPIRQNQVGTGIYTLDCAFDGGLASEELGLIMGPSNSGKTHLAVRFGAYALLTGKRIVHFTSEQAEATVARYYYASLSGKDIGQVSATPRFLTKILKHLEAEGSQCQIIRLIPDECDTQDVSISLANLPFKPDLVILDTPDDLKSRRYTERRLELGYIYRTLHGLIDRLKVPMWVTSQSNRESYRASSVRMENVSDDITKIQKADVVVTINQQSEGGNQSILRLLVAKNRVGPKEEETTVCADWKACTFSEALDSQANTANN